METFSNFGQNKSEWFLGTETLQYFRNTIAATLCSVIHVGL